ncbi:MAG: sigma 54-interacting transcriptional regulator [Firmicutes bacterium]|nr:sigma 54-interacting transcriptional regulator [Bacillota bacterium]
MTSNLLATQPMKSFLQEVAVSVSTILDLDVTIVDASLVRVAGTGAYSSVVDEQLPLLCSFGSVLRSGAPCLVSRPREDPACSTCDKHDRCRETCHLAFPLSLEDQPVGVLSLVAFTEEQRQRIVHRQVEYSSFLHHIARLVAMSLRSEVTSRKLAEERDRLNGIVDAIAEGIIAVDDMGIVVCCNRVAYEALGFDNQCVVSKPLADFIPEAPVLGILKSGTAHVNREVILPGRSRRLRHISTGTPLFSQGKVVGAVALLRTAEEAHRMVYEISERQPDRAIDHILGNDPRLQEAKKMALVAAAGNATVLLAGESGTGKELFARAIHYHSPRSDGPFVAVNCAALPEDLLESELFGYEEGAFTGAKRGGKPGKFELAAGGTIFLDEVADCSLRLQAELLRALDRREIQRIGGTCTVYVDVRVVAATNRDLETMVRQGEFREDLYYRLSVIPIHIPPLRQRKGDIGLLLDAMLQRYSRGMNHLETQISPSVRKLLCEYSWPGNVRELENTVQYMLHACTGTVIEPAHLPPRIRKKSSHSPMGVSLDPASGSLLMPADEWEKEAIAEGLRRYGNAPNAKELLARELGMSRSSIYRKIKRYGLDNL